MSVWQKQKNWWNEVLWKPKKPLSLDQLKFQHHVLLKNPVVTERNKLLLVETFRSIAEILIWGDQNDSRVFDFFLEKNMQTYFLKILTQRCGHYVCVQLLQTLNILFENIRNETSIYYLLSNNHINSIIVLKLDFSDEEVLAYYISFLKTLSFHLNKHTIHFFCNEHLRDFPLYTEAIKFFKHTEGMVRIAVRTLTLNVFKVDDKMTLEYICNKTAAPYFSNLVWFIGNHVIELDECLISQAHHLNRGRLEQLVAEHLDHLHYIADILSLGVPCLNDILSDHFLNRLLIPLYIYSLVDESGVESEEKKPGISSKVSLFLLSQVFLILSHPSLVTPLAYLLFTGDTSLTLPPALQGHKRGNSYNSVCAFMQPESSLETSLVRQSSQAHAHPITMALRQGVAGGVASASADSGWQMSCASFASQSSVEGYVDMVVDDQYVVIEASPSGSGSSSVQSSVQVHSPTSPTSPAKIRATQRLTPQLRKSKPPPTSGDHQGIPIVNQQFLNSLMSSLIIQHDDSRCLFGLSIFYAMLKNKGIHHRLLEAFSLRPKQKTQEEEGSPCYNSELVALLLSILDSCTSASNSIRLITLKLAIMLLTELLQGGRAGGQVVQNPPTVEGALGEVAQNPPTVEGAGVGTGRGAGDAEVHLEDHHVALVEHIYESAILRLRLFYKGPQDEVFLDMFEDEYEKEKSFKLKVSFMMMDETMLLPPTNTPLTGIDFTRRLPCGEHEKARKALRVFFAMRRLSQQMSGEEEAVLPLTKDANSASIGDVVDMDNCDLVSCQMVVGEKTTQHFMVFNETEFLLVDPHKSKLGCGVVHFIAFLQDIDISGDPADTHSLFVVVHSRNSAHKRPTLSGRFVFEDHIRCIAAKSVFQRARDHLHHFKMTRITKMLHLPVPDSPSAVPVEGRDREKQPLDTTSPSTPTPTPTPVINVPYGPRFCGTPPPLSPSPQISSSVLHRVFSGASTLNPPGPARSQEIELSALTTSKYGAQLHSSLPVDDLLGFSPVRLTVPAAALEFAGPLTVETGYRSDRSSRDLSLTPGPPSYASSADEGYRAEEALTANGGMFGQLPDASDLIMVDERRTGDVSGEGIPPGLDHGEGEGVCHLGVGPGMESVVSAVMDRLDTTGESVIKQQQQQTSQHCESEQPTELVQRGEKLIEHAQLSVHPPEHGPLKDHPSLEGITACQPTEPNQLNTSNGSYSTETNQLHIEITEHTQTSPKNMDVGDAVQYEAAATKTAGVSTEHAQCVDTEHAQNVGTQYGTPNIATQCGEVVDSPRNSLEPQASSNQSNLSNQSILSNKSPPSLEAEALATTDASCGLVTAETGERTPPSSNSQLDLFVMHT